MAGKTTRSDSTTTRRIIHLHHLQTKLPQRNFSAAELLEMSETSQLIVILCKTCFKNISRKLDVSALRGIIYLEEQREWIRSDGERKELTGEEREAEKRKRRRRDEKSRRPETWREDGADQRGDQRDGWSRTSRPRGCEIIRERRGATGRKETTGRGHDSRYGPGWFRTEQLLIVIRTLRHWTRTRRDSSGLVELFWYDATS